MKLPPTLQAIFIFTLFSGQLLLCAAQAQESNEKTKILQNQILESVRNQLPFEFSSQASKSNDLNILSQEKKWRGQIAEVKTYIDSVALQFTNPAEVQKFFELTFEVTSRGLIVKTTTPAQNRFKNGIEIRASSYTARLIQGSGKTSVALYALKSTAADDGLNRALLLCPTTVAEYDKKKRGSIPRFVASGYKLGAYQIKASAEARGSLTTGSKPGTILGEILLSPIFPQPLLGLDTVTSVSPKFELRYLSKEEPKIVTWHPPLSEDSIAIRLHQKLPDGSEREVKRESKVTLFFAPSSEPLAIKFAGELALIEPLGCYGMVIEN